MKLIKACVLVFSMAVFSSAAVDAKSPTRPFANNGLVKPDSTRGEALIKRLEEIRAMDFASMSPPEKKKLRKEVRSLTKEVRGIHGGGVYVSTAGIIIVILLLIIIL